jgi:hypothetical protein
MEISVSNSAIPPGVTVKSKTPTSITMSANASSDSIGKGSSIDVEFSGFYAASDDSIFCFAQAWKQVSSAAADAVTAATAYDTIADAPDDELMSAIRSIESGLTKQQPWPTSTAPASAQAAAQLVAFGQAMSSSFSSANLQKLQSELDLVKSQFGAK